MTSKNKTSGTILRIAVVFEAGIFLFAWVLGWLLRIPTVKQMNPTWTSLAVGILATGPLLAGMWWCSRSQLTPLRVLMHQVDESIVPLFLGASSGTLLVISLLAGLGEELLFRGVFMTGLAGWFGLPVALVATSVLFGLAHLITPTYALLAGLIGIYFGILAVFTGGLFAPVLAHALYDWAALSYLVSSKRSKAP